ncbi:hypothetical protein E4T47_04382 [Aureobasidium subglaciale]|nr:hypothetical protein E4T47_04382 [Aureobasidium subglaciale]
MSDTVTVSMTTPDGHTSLLEVPPRAPLRGTGVRYAPTPLHPTARGSIRTNFKSFHEVTTIVVGGQHVQDSHSRGQGQTTYTIHKDLLTAESPFFSAALNGAFAEGLDQTVRLPEEKPEIFEWFLWWLYTGSLTTPAPTNCHTESRHQRMHGVLGLPGQGPPFQHHMIHTDGDLRNTAGSPKYFLLLDLYALSDKLMTTTLCNHIVDTIARLSESTNSVPTPSDTWILYDTIRDNAPMRKLILDLFAYKKTDKLLESHKDEWHPRFLRELVVKLKRPGLESLDRHSLSPWRPVSWQTTKACESCRELLKPGISCEKCEVCERAFCCGCASAGKTSSLGGDVGTCKPWLKGMCSRYHEHGPGEDESKRCAR